MNKPIYFVSYRYSGENYRGSFEGYGNMADVSVSWDGKPSVLRPEHIEDLTAHIQSKLLVGAKVVITGWQRFEDADE